MRKRILLCLMVCLTFLVLVACNGKKNKYDFRKDRTGVYYQIFVRSFADSDGDGIGDFKGITQSLDYLKDLGVSGLWLMPIHPTDSYHGYDVKDYYAVNPEFGTMEDFEEMVKEAHKREIKVIIDLVLNHTSSNHQWFLDSTHPDSPYRDYYHWTKEGDTRIGKVSMTGNPIWHKKGDEYFASSFPGSYADLNFTSEKVKEEVVNIGKFWLEKGVNGFRLDAAMYLFETNKVPSGYTYKHNIYFWHEFRDKLREIDPNVYIVGEVYTNHTMYTQYYKGLDSTFNFDLANQLVTVARNGSGPYVNFIDRIYDQIEREGGSVNQDSPFIRNHDMDRTASELNGDIERQKLAAEMLLTLPGNPYIYYGEEIGMYGKKTEGTLNVYDETRRLPFVWGDPDKETTWMSKTCKDLQSALSLDPCAQPIDPAIKQMEDPDSLYSVFKELIALRKKHPALHSGEFLPYTDKEFYSYSTQGFFRYTDKQLLLVLHNFGSTEKDLPSFENAKLIYESSRANSYANGKIGARSTIILELPRNYID